MIGNETEHSPEQAVENLEVLSELEARDVFELGGDEKGRDIPGDGTRSRLWLTLRIAALIMLGVVLVIAAVFRYINQPEPTPQVRVVNNGGLLEPPIRKAAPAPPVDPGVNDAALSAKMSELYYWRMDLGNRYPVLMHQSADGVLLAGAGRSRRNLGMLYAIDGGRITHSRDTSVVDEGWQRRVALFGEDGWPYVVTANAETGVSRITRLDSRFEPRWSYDVTGTVGCLVTSEDGRRVYAGFLPLSDNRDLGLQLVALDGTGELIYQTEVMPRSLGKKKRYSEVDSEQPYIHPGPRGGVFLRILDPGVADQDQVLALDARGQEVYRRAVLLDEVMEYADPVQMEEYPGMFRRLHNRVQELFPLDDGSVVVVSCADHDELGACQLLDPAGEVVWRTRTGEFNAVPSQVPGDGRVYTIHRTASFDIADNVIAAIDLTDGRRLWDCAVGTGQAFLVGPDSSVYVANNRGDLIAINSDGAVKWRYDNEQAHGPLVLRDGLLFNLGHSVKAYRTDGIENFQLTTEPCRWPVLGSDGTIYYSTQEGEVVAQKNPLLQEID